MKNFINPIARDVFHMPLRSLNSFKCYLIENYLINSGIDKSGKKLLQLFDVFKENEYAINRTYSCLQNISKLISFIIIIHFFYHINETKRDGFQGLGDVLIDIELLTTVKEIHLIQNIFTFKSEIFMKSIEKVYQLCLRVNCFKLGLFEHGF